MALKYHFFLSQNVSIAIVGIDKDFTVYEDAAVDPYLELIAGEERRGGQAAAQEESAEGDKESTDDAATMETD